MDIFSMQCLLSAAETLNLSKAALQMHITQPAMSIQIKKLEQGKPDLAFLEAADAKGRDALKWTPLFDDYGCFAMAKEHPLAALKQIAPADLRDQTIYFNLRPSASMQTIFQKLVQSGIPPEKLACVEGTETAIAQALAYGGLAAVPMT